jgi:hypothetical protein
MTKLTAAVLLDHWHHLPALDPAAFRRDIDRALDPEV